MITPKINPDYEALLPPLPPTEYEALKRSIKENGLFVPILVNPKREILDGHHRFRACGELGIEPRHEVRALGNPASERRFVIESNLQRRHLTPFARIEMALPLLGIERELARRRHGRKSAQIWADSGKAAEIVAERIGVSHGLFEMALWVLEHAPEPDLKKLRKGEVVISNLYKETKRWQALHVLKEEARHIKPPEGEYGVIVVDPPWPYGTEYDPQGRRVASPYPEMSLEELRSLELPAAEHCVLWLWTTNRFMHDAFHLLERWGFEPKTILTWEKNRMGLGDWLRGKTEHCILAIKGHPQRNLTRETTILHGKARGHSEKPEEFYELVESLCFGRKLDYFARKKREGWDTYGTFEKSV